MKRFGTDLTAPFELDVVIGGQVLRTINVGYGVSQVLPIIVDLIAGRQGSWYAVQQPEVHLHPKAQAALGDLIYELEVILSDLFLVNSPKCHQQEIKYSLRKKKQFTQAIKPLYE